MRCVSSRSVSICGILRTASSNGKMLTFRVDTFRPTASVLLADRFLLPLCSAEYYSLIDRPISFLLKCELIKQRVRIVDGAECRVVVCRPWSLFVSPFSSAKKEEGTPGAHLVLTVKRGIASTENGKRATGADSRTKYSTRYLVVYLLGPSPFLPIAKSLLIRMPSPSPVTWSTKTKWLSTIFKIIRLFFIQLSFSLSDINSAVHIQCMPISVP